MRRFVFVGYNDFCTQTLRTDLPWSWPCSLTTISCLEDSLARAGCPVASVYYITGGPERAFHTNRHDMFEVSDEGTVTPSP